MARGVDRYFSQFNLNRFLLIRDALREACLFFDQDSSFLRPSYIENRLDGVIDRWGGAEGFHGSITKLAARAQQNPITYADLEELLQVTQTWGRNVRERLHGLPTYRKPLSNISLEEARDMSLPERHVIELFLYKAIAAHTDGFKKMLARPVNQIAPTMTEVVARVGRHSKRPGALAAIANALDELGLE